MKFLPIYFFVSLLIGFFIVYVTSPDPDIVIKHPNPDNIDNLTYIDDNDVCYKYSKKKITCPSDKSGLVKY